MVFAAELSKEQFYNICKNLSCSKESKMSLSGAPFFGYSPDMTGMIKQVVSSGMSGGSIALSGGGIAMSGGGSVGKPVPSQTYAPARKRPKFQTNWGMAGGGSGAASSRGSVRRLKEPKILSAKASDELHEIFENIRGAEQEAQTELGMVGGRHMVGGMVRRRRRRRRTMKGGMVRKAARRVVRKVRTGRKRMMGGSLKSVARKASRGVKKATKFANSPAGQALTGALLGAI